MEPSAGGGLSAPETSVPPCAGDDAPLLPPAEGPEASKGHSLFVGWTMSVNLLVGACLLNVPYAFAKAGIPFSIGFLVLTSLACYITMGYLMEVQGRLRALICRCALWDGGAWNTPFCDARAVFWVLTGRSDRVACRGPHL